MSQDQMSHVIEVYDITFDITFTQNYFILKC